MASQQSGDLEQMYDVESVCRPASRRVGGVWRAAVAAICLAALVLGCAEKSQDRRAEFEELLAAGDYDDALARVKLYQEAGEDGPALDYAKGVALLHQNADNIAIPLLRRAAESDSTYALPASDHLSELAWEDWKSDWTERAARRMKEAYVLDPSIDLGPMKDKVGDLFFRKDEDYPRAYSVYRLLYGERDGPPEKVHEWVFRYGYCLEKTQSPEAAMAIYEEFRKTWPEDRNFGRYVNWRYMKLTMGYASDAAQRGRFDEAIRWYQKALDTGWHMDLQQEIRYRMGVLEKERGNFEEARDFFEKVVAQGSEFGGEFVTKSEQGLDELHAMGVH